MDAEVMRKDGLQRAAARIEQSWAADCIICMSETRALRFDCGHLVCCDECARRLESAKSECPICKVQPISCTLFSDLPVPAGRQPTYDSPKAAFARVAEALRAGTAAMQEEAALALLQKVSSQEEDSDLATLAGSGVVQPLVTLLLADGSERARECAVVTLGMLATAACDEIQEAGGVVALMMLVSPPSDSPVHEHAALALSGLAEADSVGVSTAVISAGGFGGL
eukprot:5648555-Prymnesium_polylepis.1